MNVAVIGGGYAGMAAAVTLAERSVPVTVYEAGKALGGRARRIEHDDLALDNGLHILIGAYVETLRLMRLVGADPGRQLLRIPFSWEVHERLSLGAVSLPAPLNLLAGLLVARGLSLRDRLGVARFLVAMRRAGYRLPRDTSVASLLDRERQGAAAVRLLWGPLCVSALNTPTGRASAQVFLNVLRDSLDAGREASDLLLPRADLSALFPAPAAAWVTARGGTVLTGQRVTTVDAVAGGYAVRHAAGAPAYSHVICAVAPHQVKALLARIPDLADLAQSMDRFAYQPIYSVYLQYPGAVRLPAPMLGFDSALLQWAFDRGALCGQAGLIGLVISAEGMHEEHTHDALARLVHQELQQQLGVLPVPRWHQVVAERRATFACVPGLARPAHRTPLDNFVLAGDYTASDYPATIESAVRSGIAAARLIVEQRRG
jgi:squalene-associated FAD-dependent desaturase